MSARGSVLVFDCGTSALKVALFALDGELLRLATREQRVDNPAPGRAEQSPEETLRALGDAVREALVGTDPSSVQAIAVSNQRGTVVALDSDGRPLTEFVLWMDARGLPWVERIKADVGAAAYYDISGHPAVVQTGVSKVLWLRHEAPGLWQRAAVVAPPQTFLLKWLGSEGLVCDESTGSFLFPMEIGRRTWSTALASQLDVAVEKLPRLVRATEIVGRLTRKVAEGLGLPAGIPLVAGGGDGQCAGAGAGVVRAGRVLVNVGTAAGVQTFLSGPRLDPRRTLNCAAHVVPAAWEMEGHTQASGAALRWLRDLCGGPAVTYDRLVAEGAATEPGADGLLFLPTFNGTSAPLIAPLARGCVLGLTLSHGRAHVIRALLEGVALEIRWILDAMAEAGAPTEDVRLAGGGSRSPAWNRIYADVLGCPIRVPQVADAAAVGAAMCATVALGIHPTFSEAAAAFVTLSAAVEPQPANRALYDERYAAYREVFLALSASAGFRRLAAGAEVLPS